MFEIIKLAGTDPTSKNDIFQDAGQNILRTAGSTRLKFSVIVQTILYCVLSELEFTKKTSIQNNSGFWKEKIKYFF